MMQKLQSIQHLQLFRLLYDEFKNLAIDFAEFDVPDKNGTPIKGRVGFNEHLYGSYDTIINKYGNMVISLKNKSSDFKAFTSRVDKILKKLVNIQEKLKECEDMEKYRLYGELITSNLYKINNNINIENIELENYYDNNNLITIPLDKKISPSLNAKKFFKKYNKLKNTLEIVTKQKLQLQSDIVYIETIIYALENAKNVEDINQIHEEIEESILGKTVRSNSKEIKNKNNNTTEILTAKIDNFTVYIGKNNKQNDYITFKLSDKTDIWFHVQGYHGSHVLLKTNGQTISNDNPIIVKCAKLAALHSKASDENKVLVDYTLIKNIKKPKGSKPGFVVFNNYNTITISL